MISTHVLDTSKGMPAAGVTVQLFRVDAESRELIATSQTDDDGRISPMFGGDLDAGTYELLFSAGEYFATAGTQTFFQDVPVRFVINSGTHKLHIPLLLAPFGYSTYKGS